jgi:hypothetical protein
MKTFTQPKDGFEQKLGKEFRTNDLSPRHFLSIDSTLAETPGLGPFGSGILLPGADRIFCMVASHFGAVLPKSF